MDTYTRDALLCGMHHNPDDKSRIAIFADWLEENDHPTRPRRGIAPAWVRNAWARVTRPVRRPLPRNRQADSPLARLRLFRWHGYMPAYLLELELQANAAALGFSPDIVTYFGTGPVADIPNCLVFEPQADFADVYTALTGFARLVGGVAVAGRQAARGPGYVRLAIVPPPPKE
jgi:uncharacterized protein (TIGR02996 family)